MPSEIFTLVYNYLSENHILLILAVIAFFMFKDITRRIDDSEDDIKTISKNINSLIKEFIRLTSCLKTKGVIDHDSFLETNSPLRLTETGHKMIEESKLKEIIDRNKDYFVKLIKEKSPKTNYDKQQLCHEVLMNESDKDFMIPAKNYAFDNGRDLTSMLLAASVYLRDLIIKEQLSVIPSTKPRKT